MFTQTTTDPEGRPVRDEDSTTYVAAIETAEAQLGAGELEVGPRRTVLNNK